VGDSPSVEATRERIDRFLRDVLGQVATDDQGDFMVDVGPATVWVRPVPWTHDRTLVNIWAVTNVGVRVDAELARFLLTTNATWPVGGFRLVQHPDGSEVVMAHSLLGEYLNRAELDFAVSAVASATERFAPTIKERFGGTLFKEMM
jgi:hypothetical protein